MSERFLKYETEHENHLVDKNGILIDSIYTIDCANAPNVTLGKIVASPAYQITIDISDLPPYYNYTNHNNYYIRLVLKNRDATIFTKNINVCYGLKLCYISSVYVVFETYNVSGYCVHAVKIEDGTETIRSFYTTSEEIRSLEERINALEQKLLTTQ